MDIYDQMSDFKILSQNMFSPKECRITYRIRKKFRGVFNFVFFVDDKDPQNFFH